MGLRPHTEASTKRRIAVTENFERETGLKAFAAWMASPDTTAPDRVAELQARQTAAV